MHRKPSRSANYLIIKNLILRIRETLVRHPYILLLIALTIIASPIMGSGIIIGGDFPVLDTGNYAYDKLWIWLQKGGVPIYEGISRFPITSLWYILSFVGLDASLASKIMILTGFFVASFSFYFSFLLFFRGKQIVGKFNESNFYLKVGAILGSLLFAYNIWSFHRIAHWHLWVGYSLIPLFFISTYLSFRNPKDWKYILCSVFLWSFASMTPHMAVYYGFIFASIFLFFVFHYAISNKPIRMQILNLLPLVLVLSIFALINFYWIYPYILGSNLRPISPDYVVTREVVGVLSSDSSFYNTFRIVADYQGSLQAYIFEPGSFLRSLWLVATFAIPIFAFSTLIISGRLLKYSLIFSGMAIIGIVMAMGTNSFFDYYKLLFGIPALSNYLWIFRDPDKFSFLITFGYSFLIGIGAYKVLQNISNIRKLGLRMKRISSTLCILLLIAFISVSAYPAFNSHILNIYKPIPLPLEFDSLNHYLSSQDTDKVYFMPYPLAETYWQKKDDIGRIYQMHSIKTSIESTDTANKNYYNYLVSSIIENRSKSIDDLIYPLGTSYLIFHNDTWNRYENISRLEDKQLLNRIYSLDDIKNIQNIGFYNIFNVGNETANQFSLYNRTNIAIGGLELLDTLNAMRDFSALNSSIAFIDGALPNNLREYVEDSDAIVTRKTSLEDLIFSFIDDKHIVSPFDIVYSYDPSKMWSRAGATDPLHAELHPFLERLGIYNREFDFGKGLVMTSAMGTNVTIPMEVSKGDKYDLAIRLLENSRGGIVNIYLDGKLIDSVKTLGSKTSNEFVWKNISHHPIYLESGKHTITLENVIGMNVVNIIDVVPSDLMDKLAEKANHIINTKRVIYLMEGESSFDNIRGRDVGTAQFVFNNGTINPGSNTSISGQFRVPKDSDLVSLKILEKNGTNLESVGNINNFVVYPAEETINLLRMDFKRKGVDVPLALLRNSEWINNNKDSLNLSREMANPISGNASLRVDVNPVDRNDWSIISTDFIPINDNRHYKLSMDVRGKDVHNFHVRISNYDSDKELADRDIIYEAKHDSFDDKFAVSIDPPKSSKFIKIQILVPAEHKRYGTYFIDNVNLDEIIPNISHEFRLGSTESKFIKPTGVAGAKSKQFSSVEGSNKSVLSQTDSILVDENRLYNYTANINNKFSEPLGGLLTFGSSDDVIENSTRYGTEASGGSVLSIAANSEISTEVDIIKPANYTFTFRMSICQTCNLTLIVDRLNGSENVVETAINTENSSSSSSALEWVYLKNTYLSKGKYAIRLVPNAQMDLDLFAMYSENEPSRAMNLGEPQNILSSREGDQPAYLSNYSKVSPTKYALEIKNATRPFVLSLAESYDPLWTAHTSEIQNNVNKQGKENYEFKTNSIPLFSIINGFQINKTGSYSLTIEYEPQDWFFKGATVSAIMIVLLLSMVIAYYIIRRIKISDRIKRRLDLRQLSKH